MGHHQQRLLLRMHPLVQPLPTFAKPKAVDLFSGCGGLTCGLDLAGFDVVGAVEIEKGAVEAYLLNFPKVHVWEKDIRKVTSKEMLNILGLKKGELDLLAGCPPCQGFSTINTKNGKVVIDNENNNLVYQFLRLIRELRPKTIMMENVPALAVNGRMTKFLAAIGKLGYYNGPDAVQVLDVSNYGVPQRRKRMVLLTSTKGPVTYAQPVAERATVQQFIGGLAKPGETGDAMHDVIEKRSEAVMTKIRAIPHDGGSRSDLPDEMQLPCHQRCDGFKDIYGRMAWGNVAPTITGGCTNPSKGRFLHPEQDRAITPREAALLQTFPGDYKFNAYIGKEKLALMIGNALPPLFIKAHAVQITSALHKYKLA